MLLKLCSVVQLLELISLIVLLCCLLGAIMPPTYFPLRWESTGDQWWYASPIDWAAANGHFDLVRELLRIDSNHLIKLTSLRRIRRLETVWDDEEQFDDVAKCRSDVARKLFHECESKKAKNSLIQAGYGGWLIYTAASAGDLSFIQELLERNPLLVFGEGEYGVTDILYAAARSKNSEVFRIVYDFCVSPRFLSPKGGHFEEQIPSLYKWEMTNRGVHAAARGGNLTLLQELLCDCTDVLAYRDKEGSTILHAAAAKGQVEIVKYLIASFDIIKATDNQGNTALHIAANRGQSSVVEALLTSSPLLVSSTNNAGETFLHMAVSGLQTPAFKRLDRQIELMKRLISGKNFNIEEIINAKNNDGRTALHSAIIGNVHSDLVQLLMSARSIDVNVRDADGMTPLDLLKQVPSYPSSDILIRQLISAGGIFSCHDYTARRAIATCLKMQGNGISPGTSFRISDAEIFLYTGVEIIASNVNAGSAGERTSSFSAENLENRNSGTHKKSNSFVIAAQQLKKALYWPRMKGKKPEMFRKSVDQASVESSYSKCNSSEETPTPLRQRFTKPLTVPNNKRSLAVRSNQSSPTAKKKFASGIMHGVMQAIPQITVPHRSRSSSFSKSPISSPIPQEKQKGIFIDNDIAGPSSFSQSLDYKTAEVVIEKDSSMNKRLRRQYFCFGGSSLSVRNPVSRPRQSHSSNPSVISVA